MPGPTRHRLKGTLGPVILFACAVVTAVVGVATPLVSQMPRVVVIVAAGVAGLAGIITAYRTMRPPEAAEDNPHSPVDVRSEPRRPLVRPFWFGATLVFAVLALVFWPSIFPMIVTGLIAFSRSKMAAGVAVALAGVVGGLVLLLQLSGAFEEPVSDPYQECIFQGYPPDYCAQVTQ